MQQILQVGRGVAQAKPDAAAGRRELEPCKRVHRLEVGRRDPRHVQLDDGPHLQEAATAGR